MYGAAKTTSRVTWLGLAAAILFCLQPIAALGATVDGSCSEGNGVPPFLSSGADPNLLMILDNSGSMLDPAYIDDDGVTISVDTKDVATCVQDPVATPNPTACMDESYLVDPTKTTCNADGTFNAALDPAKTYAGYFKKDSMYAWKVGTLPAIVTTYADVASAGCVEPAVARNYLIFDNSVLYRAECNTTNCTTAALTPGCTPSGITVAEDNKTSSGYNWIPYFSFETWVPNKSYPAGTFVKYEKQLYYAKADTVPALNATSPSPDNWQPVNHTWLPGTSYGAKALVSYNGMVFYNSGASTTVEPPNTPWKRINDSYFAEDSTGCLDPSFTYTHTDSSGTQVTDMQVTMYNKAGNKVDATVILKIEDITKQLNIELAKPNPDPVVVTSLKDQRNALMPSQTTCFAATGNFLNWAAASKFDIQKKILTGGKLYNGTGGDYGPGGPSDDEDDRLVMENRGCAGKNFVKQITVDTSNNIKMTLRVRGSSEGDWLGTNDDVTRIDIFGITVGGYDDKQCRLAVDLMENNGSLPDIRAALEKCMYADNAPSDEHDSKTKQIYFSAVHTCVQSAKAGGDLDDYNKAGELATFCTDLYLGKNGFNATNPWDITPYDAEYICYGMYNPSSTYPYTTDTGGLGFMGRLWRTYPEDVFDCNTSCNCTDKSIHPWKAGASAGDCYIGIAPPSKDEIHCTNNQLTYWTYISKGNYTKTPRYEDPKTGIPCTPTGNVKSMCGYPGDPLNPVDATCWAPTTSGGQAPASDDMWKYALRDYCRQVEVPEVIDPSDQVTSTPGSGNIPASLIDTGMYDQLGQGQPLMTMKGYLKWVIPADQGQEHDPANSSFIHTQERPIGPRGVLYDVAPKLRLGIMAFKDNGSQAECDKLQATCGTKENDIFAVCDKANAMYNATDCQYCLEREPIDKFCPAVNGDGASVITAIEVGMYIDKSDPINSTERWGHYKTIRSAINTTRATSWTPLAEALYTALAYYGQKTANDFRLSPNAEYPDIFDFRTAAEVPAYVSGTTYKPGALVEYNDTYYQTALGGVANSPGGPDQDTGIFWSEVNNLDPIQYWCQDNHVLIITEGASTSDINQKVIDFVNDSALQNDNNDPPQALTDGQVDSICTGGLEGSTYLDDLTYIGNNAQASYLYTVPQINGHDKQKIFTHVVTTGSLRADGTGECSPKTLMQEAAADGGTNLYTGESPEQLESNLRAALGDIMSRASAGSAASVISSSRTGEGAAYQAIFWPKVSRGTMEDELTWIGDVHSLFVDTKSQMFDDYSGGFPTAQNVAGRLWTEDSNGNGRLDSGEDTNNNGCLDGDRRVFFYFDAGDQVSKICFNDSVRANPDAPVCNPAQTKYCGAFAEPVTIKDFTKYFWSANQQLQKIDDANITLNRPVGANGRWDWSGAKKRYIFTWNDLNNDGMVDTATEILGLDNKTATYLQGTDWATLSSLSGSDPTNYQHDILKDFNVTDAGKMTELVDWLRGADELYEWGTGPDTNPADGVPDFNPLVDDINGNGKQDYVYRCRRYPACVPPNDPSLSTNPVWRLGDIIHSTPTLVAQPAEGYHTLYRDPSYAWFVKKYRYRRQVVYFGANDGMMHATNSGFFHEGTTSFCRELNPNYNITDTDTTNDEPCLLDGPELGDELWAYVPYNLAPHLKCMSDPNYDHKYFVDQKPRVMDVQIFAEESVCATSLDDPACIHPQGWGTILIGAMRFGGAPVNAADTPPLVDNRRFISSYFILDVTDPERPPELLGEMTMTRDSITGSPVEADLGYTVPIPTGVVMRDDAGRSTWYLVFGSGPETLAGENTQQGKLAVLPLNRLKGGINWDTTTKPPRPLNYSDPNYPRKPFRIPNLPPSADLSVDNYASGIISIPADASGNTSSFTGDLVNIDYNVNAQITSNLGSLYKSDAIYFGTVDGTGFTAYDPSIPDVKHWDGGGRLFRLITRNGIPGDPLQVSTPDQWTLTQFIDAKAPITAAPGLGWDGGNYWIYFGTGRFFDKDDKTDEDPNYFFGIKEPVRLATDAEIAAKSYEFKDKCAMARKLVWDPITFNVEAPGIPAPNASPGSRGLFRADHVLVAYKQNFVINNKPVVFCDGSPAPDCPLSSLGLAALPQPSGDTGGPYYAFDDMRDYVAGRCDATTDQTRGIDGWYRLLRDPRERNIGQSTLLGGLTTFTTYQPYSDICTAEGLSYLYGVHFQTGTAWYQDIFGTDTVSNKEIVRDRLGLGRGLATNPSLHVGRGPNDATAIIQTSTGEIVEVPEKELPFTPKPPGKAGWTDSCD